MHTFIATLSVDWPSVWDHTQNVVAFLSDLVGLVLAALALIALLTQRKRIRLLYRILLGQFLRDRIRRAKETLDTLASVNFDEKERRKEVFALLGAVAGQLKTFSTDDSELRAIHAEIMAVLGDRRKFTEAVKQRIVHEAHSVLDGIAFARTQEVLEETR